MKVTDAFLGEHAVFYAQFLACEASLRTDDIAALQQNAALIASALVPHAHLENDLLFDLLDERGVPPDMVAVMRQEHQEIDGGLTEIQTTRDTECARALLTEVIAAARAHFEKEERMLFPLAEQTLSSADQLRLGAAWAAARRVHVD